MNVAHKISSLSELKANPDWTKLSLFDRKRWKRLPFGTFAESVNERVEPANAAEEIYVGLDDLDSGNLHIRRWGKGSDVIGTKLRFRKGDIIFGRRRAYQRKLAVAEFDGICSAHAMVVRARPEMVLPEFLPFLMMSDRFMKRAVEISVGSLSPTINWKTLKLEEFDLPPLDQQLRIAEILTAGDLATVEFSHASRSSVEVVNTRLASFFGSFANARKLQISAYPLGDVAHLQTGIAKGKNYAPGVPTVELPYLRVANVQDGYLDLGEMKTIVIPESDRDRYLLKNDDVVICEGGDFDQVGRGAIWRGQAAECLHQNHVFSLRANLKVLMPEFLSFQLASPYGKGYFLSCAKKTSNLASINAKQVRAFPFQLPPIEAQRQLVSELSELQGLSAALQAHTVASSQVLRVLTEAVA